MKSNAVSAGFRHPFLSSTHPTVVTRFFTFVLLFALGISCVPAGAAQKKPTRQEIYASQSLLYISVFTDKGFALPGAELKIRRATDKKPKWDGNSDARGEFAIRVPGGADYEILVKAKGYQPMTKMVKNAPVGDRLDLVFRLQIATAENNK